jgi:hypothetical protein
MRRVINLISTIVLALVFAGVFYYYYPSVSKIIIPQKPCSGTVYYSLGTFDNRFGLTQKDFIEDLKMSEAVWEKASGKNLFEYSPTGKMKINLIYDNRQKVTDELKLQGIDIDNYKATYDTLKAKYDLAGALLEKQKAIFKTESQSYDTRQAAYNKQVKYWNEHGGAPKKEYAALQEEKSNLSVLANNLNTMQVAINTLVNDINGLVLLLNNVAQKLNNKVETFNTVGSSNGEKFSEGEYVVDNSGTRINIYQFQNKDKLIRVLEHEFGHAINLEHVDDQNSIMYLLNTSNNIALTKADIAELDRVCKE